jgi:Tfp pilus assembly protein PilF
MEIRSLHCRASLITARLIAALLGVGLIGLVIFAVGYKWWTGREQSTDRKDNSQPVWQSPYRNTSPEVRYVGDEACARCHKDMAAAYRKHPMSRSLAPVSSAEPLEKYDSSAHNPFDAQGFHYLVEREGNRVCHKETRLDKSGKVLVETKAEVQYALGSGAHGRAYLVNHDGFVFQSPISWFTQANRWDLSPGYQGKNVHFTRPIVAECLSCHSNKADAVPDSINRFREPIFEGFAIGCERCHGPGELHVREREKQTEFKGIDDTIVNPARLEPALREAVCQQCHLQGEIHVLRCGRQLADFRPGLPLHDFISIYIRSAGHLDQKMAVGQVEQMYASRCFQESNGKLGCASCHDPHDYPAPAERTEFYRGRCLTCHEEQACKLDSKIRRMKSPEDSCIECHMPAFPTADIAHAAATNHRIPRIPGTTIRAPATSKPLSKYLLTLFPNEPSDSRDDDRDRDLGIALTELARMSQIMRPASQALDLLEPGLQKQPDDVAAWEAKGLALSFLNQPRESLEAFEKALELHPQRENSLARAAMMAAKLHCPEKALDYWKKAIEVNPWNWQYYNELAFLEADKKDWKSAAQHCQKTLALNSTSLDTRQLLIDCYIQLGDQTRSKAELDILLGLSPDPEAMRRWFEERSGSRTNK